MTLLHDVLGRLENVQRLGDHEAKANCPCHASKSKASLSVKVANDGRILLHCFGGCETERIVEAMGLEMRDLMPDDDHRQPVTSSPRPSSNGRGSRSPSEAFASHAAYARRKGGPDLTDKPDRVFEYRDESNRTLGFVARWETPSGKHVRPFSLNGSGWECKGLPKPRPLYNLPGIAKVRESGGVVFVVEGEKAAQALIDIGFTATTCQFGCKSADGADWGPLAGQTSVLADENGRVAGVDERHRRIRLITSRDQRLDSGGVRLADRCFVALVFA